MGTHAPFERKKRLKCWWAPTKMECSCPLCLESCRVPVEITGFPCYSSDGIHCHTMIRYCRSCCVRLFELEKPCLERKQFLRCLYCDTSVDPQSLTTVPFRTDHFLIRQDSAVDMACPYCDHVAPDHQHLEKHCAQACAHTPRIPCRGCGAFHTGGDASASAHESLCTTQEAAHSPPLQVCLRCEKCTLLPMDQHLESECLLRPMACKYCNESIPALHFTDHLLFHREESRNRCQLLTEVLEKEREWGKRILQECREFYGDMYQEALEPSS